MSEPSYHSTKFFTENLLTIKRGKTEIIKNKLVYLDLSVLELRKIVMYEFLYDCETEIWKKGKTMLYVYSFIVYIKTDGIYKDIAEDVETRFDTSNYEFDRPLPKRKLKK